MQLYFSLHVVFVSHFEGVFSQGEIGEPGQKGSKGDKGEHVSMYLSHPEILPLIQFFW